MKNKSLLQIIVVLVLFIIIIKFVPPVNDWARGNLPEPVLSIIGEKPKSIFERGSDIFKDSIDKGSELMDDIVDKVKK